MNNHDEALTNYDVQKLLKHVVGFKGTLPKDMFKGKIKPFESGVVNMDDSTGPGSHFVCYYNNQRDKTVIYFDSYGVQPPANIEKYLKTSGKLISYNTTQYQPIASVLCGYYCIYVISELWKGHSFYDTLAKLDVNDPEKNDAFMRRYFNLK